MKGRWSLRNERGSVLLFMLGTLFFLLVFGGFAVDLSFLSTAQNELQRSMDAAALAGAGQLGLDDSVFPAVRQEAQRFADLNPTRANLSALNPTGAISLDLNPANDPNGDITLGIWDGATFTPSLDGSQVNAVRCQYDTEVPTSFLGILGFNTLPVAARAIGLANPPATPEPGACVAPIGISDCAFTDEGGSYSTQGCGAPITFISSSGEDPGAPGGTNTAAWLNYDGTQTPNASYLRDLWTNIADGTCSASTASVGLQAGTNNGMIQNVMDVVETGFLQHYDPANSYTVTNASDEAVYEGGGWEMTIAVIDTSTCPAGAISGTHTVNGWTQFVMTQVINKGQCAVPNHYPGNPWDELCPPPNGTLTNPPENQDSYRAIFGYFSCEVYQSNPTSNPAPRSGIAARRKLVQ